MWEFAIRILLAGLLVGLSGWTAVPPFDAAWRIAMGVAAYAFLAYALERRKLTNPGIAGLMAGLDAFAIGTALAYAGLLPTYGFLVLGPLVYAITRRGSNAIAVGSIGAAAVLFSDGLARATAIPSSAVLAQTAGVLLVTLIANQPRVVVRPRSIREMLAEMSQPIAEEGTQALIDLRERYRRLQTSFKDLERRSRIDRVRSHLFQAKGDKGEVRQILDRLCTMLDAAGAILYVANQVGDRMTVTATAGRVPVSSPSLSFEISGREAAQHLKDRASLALKAHTEEAPAPSCNVLLRCKGRVAGLLTLLASDPSKIEELRVRADEASEAVAQILLEEQALRQTLRRMHEAELLYEMACRLDGAATEADLGRRTARALAEILPSDRISVWLLDGLRPILVGKEGRPCRSFESYVPNALEGWLAEGAPPILAYDAGKSEILDANEMVRERIGSYISVSIRSGDAVIGFISCAAPATGALGPRDAETLFDVAAEFGNALSRMRGEKRPGLGLVTAHEFQREVLEIPNEKACLVYLEPMHFEELEPTLGRPTIELAARQLGLLIRRNMPEQARVCRKSDGSFVALLPGYSLQAAQLWGHEITALASMRTYDRAPGEAPIPLAIRAKAADLSQKPEHIPA
jgi:GGDEF domain-containing protein